jgi:hypothetical protein
MTERVDFGGIVGFAEAQYHHGLAARERSLRHVENRRGTVPEQEANEMMRRIAGLVVAAWLDVQFGVRTSRQTRQFHKLNLRRRACSKLGILVTWHTISRKAEFQNSAFLPCFKATS